MVEKSEWVMYLIAKSDFKLNALKYIVLLHFEPFPAMIQFVTFNTADNVYILKLPYVGISTPKQKKIALGVKRMKYMCNKLS